MTAPPLPKLAIPVHVGTLLPTELDGQLEPIAGSL